MRKNNVLLAAAITATLVVSMNASYAEVANYPTGCVDATGTTSSTFPCNTLYTSNTVVGSVVPITDATKGVIYGTHLFGASGNDVVLPAETSGYAAVQFVVEGTPSKRLQLRATLDGAEFKVVGTNPAVTSPDLKFISPNGTTDPTPVNSAKSCTTDKKQCQWQFGDDATTLLKTGDSFYILYRITKAQANLATAGGQVKMTVDFGVVGNPQIMGTKTIVVATSQEPFKVFFEGTGNTDIKVAVADESKSFIMSKPDTTLLPNSSEAVFGYMSILNEVNVKSDNGYSDWALGSTDKVDQTIKTTLTIDDEGQFTASLTNSTGSVYLSTKGGTEQIKAESVKETAAVWELSDTELATLAGECDFKKKTSKCIPIVIKADGKTAINVPPEQGPKAVFNLSYDKSTSQDNLIYPGKDDPEQRLSRYRQDGTSCWVYNVPSPIAQDEINIRVINDSKIVPPGDDCVWGSLYGKDGKLVGNKTPLGCTTAKGTLYLTSTTGKLADLISGLTAGRGTMLITSTLAKMEVMAMLRLKSPPCFRNTDSNCSATNSNPLTNLSTGAHGVSCFN
ncbi:secreted protein [Thioploca ingrica]|uniref:Secreted protein n=1 Tax=Thioploca ingrica TaxID=40754 RepID=A0A090BU86_9GAMM|nr:secreted protein [Thioploca ingrica]